MSSSAAKSQARINEKRAAAKAAAQAERRRRRAAVAAVTAVVVAIAALVVVKAAGGSSSKPAPAAGTAPAALVTSLAAVPASVVDAVGKGSAAALTPVSSPTPLTADGKVRIVYVGAEYCPFCAAQRWAIAQALSRFGTFTGLGETSSASDDVYPDTPTLSFHGATYTSQWLSLSAYETLDRNKKPLDTTPADVNTLLSTYDAPPYVSSDDAGSIPFLDLGGATVISGASYSPQVLAGLSHAQVVAALGRPGSAVAKGIIGTANRITAAICARTGQQPAAVCSATGVKASTS